MKCSVMRFYSQYCYFIVVISNDILLLTHKKKKLVINGLITAVLKLKSRTEFEQLESYQYQIKLRSHPVSIDGHS